MRKLKLEVQMSIDGYTADADGKTDWMVWNWAADWHWDSELRQFHTSLTTTSDCLLLSRVMAQEGFYEHWGKVAAGSTDDPQYAFAKHIMEMRKFVFTRTLDRSPWENTELVNGDLVEEITRLKKQEGKDIIVYGGPTFASSLIRAGLIDEFHLFINPTALGGGSPFFKQLEGKLDLNLIAGKSYNCGVTVLTYGARN